MDINGKGKVNWSSKYAELEDEPPINTAWRRGGVKWLHVDRLSWQDEEPPHILQCPAWVEKTRRGNYLCADQKGGEVRILSPTYETVWSYSQDLNDPRYVQEHPTEDYILISDKQNNTSIEVDRNTKKILHQLTNSGLGDFDAPRARYDLDNPDRIVVADKNNHVVEELDWEGTVYNSWGEYGVAGSDASHLDSPEFASPNALGGIGIADQGNDRVLILLGDWSGISRNLVVPGPATIVRATRRANLLSSWQGGAVMTEGGCPLWWSQLPSLNFASYAGNLSIIHRRHGIVEETDIRSIHHRQRRAASHPRGLSQPTTSLNASETSDPQIVLTFLHDKTMVMAKSTEDATLEILALEGGGGLRADNTPRTWHTYDEVSMTADEIEVYLITAGTPVMAGRVTMGSTAGEYSLGTWRK